jgi:hypothetical protein
MLTRILATVALTLACGTDVRAAASLSGLPEDLVVAPVAQQMRINGLAVGISALGSEGSPEQACARIARQWQQLRNAQVSGCQRSGAWLLISRRIGMREQTVQLQASTRGSVGLLSELDLSARPIAPPLPQLPLPAGAQVRNALQSGGQGEQIAQFTVDLPLPPAVAARQLQAVAQTQGWQSGRQSGRQSGAARSPGAIVLDFERGSVDVGALLLGAGGASVLVLIERARSGRLP